MQYVTGRLYSEEELSTLRTMHKRVEKAGARWVKKPGHRQRTHQATGDENGRFEVYLRQNLLDESDFSCGIAYLPTTGSRLTLARYNGPSHKHGGIEYRPHIHRATVKAIASGKKPESHADATDRFSTLDGAFGCLISDYNLIGIMQPEGEQLRLQT